MIYRLVLLLMFFQLSFVLYAQEVTEVTLKSDKGKEVSITYSIKRNGTNADIVFSNSYVDNNNQGLVLLFSVSYHCEQINKNSTLKLDSIVQNIYDITHLNKDPLHILGNGKSTIQISNLENLSKEYYISFPIYLAEYKKQRIFGKTKEVYDLKDLCHLSIKIPQLGGSDKKNSQPNNVNQEINNNPNYDNVTDDYDDSMCDDIDEDVYAYDDVCSKREKCEKDIQQAKECLQNNASKSELKSKLEMLNGDRNELSDSDSDLIEEIDICIKSINEQLDYLEKVEKQKEQAAQDSIAAMAKQEAEAAQQRNMWLIIGGIILAVLGFVGNQVFQHVRNARNQRNMMSMQQSMVQRAENEAKRRAQSMARQKVNQVQNAARRKSQDYVRGNINSGISKISKGKKNKGISI